jgi:transaldolase
MIAPLIKNFFTTEARRTRRRKEERSKNINNYFSFLRVLRASVVKLFIREMEGHMKIFLDTANVDEIRKAHAMGMVDGVTTNPTLVAREGRDYMEILGELAEFVKGPISAEAVSSDAAGMVKEAVEFHKIADNITVKIPMCAEGLVAVRECAALGIMTNVTLIFSANQALLAAKAGASFVSPFIGRLDDIGQTGMEVIEEMRTIFDNYGFTTEILAASIRHPIHVKEAALLGADVCTIPFKILMALVEHSLTEKGIKKFLEDYEKIPKKA